MIGAILEKSVCKSCKNCCKYDDDDVWDAPGFTKSEMEQAKTLTNIPVYKKRGLYFFKMQKSENEYACPLLGDSGCKLGASKPFKCAIWPLYVVHMNSHQALVVSDKCSVVYSLPNDEIIAKLGDTVKQITDSIIENPELVEPCKPYFRFITYLR